MDKRELRRAMSVLPENDPTTKTGKTASGNNDNGATVKPGLAKGPFDWHIVLLVVYLFLLLLVSVNWLAGLLMANTSGLDDNGKKITACRPDLGSPCPWRANTNGNTNCCASPTPSPTAPANTGNANTPANIGNANRPVTNTATNANRAAAIPPGNINTPVGPINGNTNANANANTGAPDKPSTEVADVIVIKNNGLFGWDWLSACRFCDSGCLSGDGFLFLVVLFAGMLGAIVRALVYLGWFVGNRKFSITYFWYYLFQPFFGALLALIFYVVLRGGFGSTSVGKNNLYAFAAVAFLAGLFSDNAMAKLKLIAESLLVSTEKPKPPKPPKPNDGSSPPPPPPPPPGGGGGAAPDSGAGTGAGIAGATPPATGDVSVTGTYPRNIGRDEPPV